MKNRKVFGIAVIVLLFSFAALGQAGVTDYFNNFFYNQSGAGNVTNNFFFNTTAYNQTINQNITGIINETDPVWSQNYSIFQTHVSNATMDKNLSNFSNTPGFVTNSKILTAYTVGLSNTTSWSLPTGPATVVNFTIEDYDNYSMHIPNQQEIIIPSSGVYLITTFSRFLTNGSGVREIGIYVNGQDMDLPFPRAAALATAPTVLSGSTMRKFNAGDKITIGLWQDSGGAITVNKVNVQVSIVG